MLTQRPTPAPSGDGNGVSQSTAVHSTTSQRAYLSYRREILRANREQRTNTKHSRTPPSVGKGNDNNDNNNNNRPQTLKLRCVSAQAAAVSGTHFPRRGDTNNDLSKPLDMLGSTITQDNEKKNLRSFCCTSTYAYDAAKQQRGST